MNYDGLVYVDTRRNYYARWSRKKQQSTYVFTSTGPLTQYWVEMMRVNPELIETVESDDQATVL